MEPLDINVYNLPVRFNSEYSKRITKEGNHLILEILAYLSNNEMACLSSIPGTGKTSILLSVAQYFDNTLYYTKSVNSSVDVLIEYSIMRRFDKYNNFKKIGIIIGKANKAYNVCTDCNNCPSNMSIYDYCEGKKAEKKCKLLNNMLSDDSKSNEFEWNSNALKLMEDVGNLINSENLDYRGFRSIINMIKEREMCAYYILLGWALKADIKVGDMLYYLGPKFFDTLYDPTKNGLNIIDEAHVIIVRGEGYGSTHIYKNDIINLLLDNDFLDMIKKLYSPKVKDNFFNLVDSFSSYIDDIIKEMSNLMPDDDGNRRKLIDVLSDFNKNENLKNSLHYFESLKRSNFVNNIMRQRETKKPYRIAKNLIKFFERQDYYEETDSFSFVVYGEITEKDKDGKKLKIPKVAIVRQIISLRSLHEKRTEKYKLLISSATIPEKYKLHFDFGKDIKVFKSNIKADGLKIGILYNPNVSLNKDLNDRQKMNRNIDELLKIISGFHNETAIAIGGKSKAFIKNLIKFGYCDILSRELEKDGRKLFLLEQEEYTKKEDDMILKEYGEEIGKGNKVALMFSQQARYGLGSNILKGSNCDVIIGWYLPYKMRNPKVVNDAYNKSYRKFGLPPHYTAEYQYKFADVRDTLKQFQGRGSRGDDISVGIIMTNKLILPDGEKKRVLTSEFIDEMNVIEKEFSNIDELISVLKKHLKDKRKNRK